MKKAIIYVRGNNEEMQEVFCKVYAQEQKYKVLFVTNDIEAVNNCDVMLVSNVSRISRDRFKYLETVKRLKSKGIMVECVGGKKNAMRYLEFARLFMNN